MSNYSRKTNDKYIGFDIDSKKVATCVVQAGFSERYRTISSDIVSMRRFLEKEKSDGSQVHVVFEISGMAGYTYDSLIDCVDSITVANPLKMTWIYRTTKKNDRIDARKMAVLLSIGEIPKVHMPSSEVRQWRQMIRHRRNLVNKVTSVKNRIRALLKSRGYSKPLHSGSLWKKANRLWACSLAEGGRLWSVQLVGLIEELEMLEGQVNRVTETLDGCLSRHAGGSLLMSIPGVGPRTAEAVLAYTDDVGRFANSKGFCSYFGVTPKLDESGTSRRIGHISKEGPSVVRWVLVESSWKVVRYSPAMKRFYERVLAGQKGRKKIAIVAVARKLLSIMRAMMVTGELYNERLVDGTEAYVEVRRAG
jgi:transposase